MLRMRHSLIKLSFDTRRVINFSKGSYYIIVFSCSSVVIGPIWPLKCAECDTCPFHSKLKPYGEFSKGCHMTKSYFSGSVNFLIWLLCPSDRETGQNGMLLHFIVIWVPVSRFYQLSHILFILFHWTKCVHLSSQMVRKIHYLFD